MYCAIVLLPFKKPVQAICLFVTCMNTSTRGCVEYSQSISACADFTVDERLRTRDERSIILREEGG